MSWSQPQAFLFAYDITDPRRLVRVHRFLRERAVALQYSVFAGVMSPRQLESVLAGIKGLIDSASDDVRVYPLPAHPEVVGLGRQSLPEGILLTEPRLAPLLTLWPREVQPEKGILSENLR